MKKTLVFIISLAFTSALFAQKNAFEEKQIRKHIGYLASDELGGREPGTPGEQLAIAYLVAEFKKLGLDARGVDGFLQPFEYKTRSNPHDTVGTGKQKKGTNVIAFLDNKKAKTIVIGAHFDHLGHDAHPSSLDTNKTGIHHGADDNASGTAGVLELARYYVNNKTTEPCNFLFMCFSGEEDGLIGSKYYSNNPTQPLSQILCMVNMDMIGRLNDSTQKLMIYGVGTSPAYTSVFGNLKTDLKFVYDSSGVGPSDQTSFYLKNIPVLHFFTGQHKDYHKSTDTREKINYAGEAKVLGIIADVVNGLSKLDSMPFTQTRQSESAKVSFKVTLGIMPDYTFEGKGVRVDGTSPGKPAANGGIKTGDVILKLGAVEIADMNSYMKALNQFKKGDSAPVEIKRGSETLKLDVTF